MKSDIFSNYVTQIINILIRFFLIPIYLSELGVSAFGIIGFYYSIESIMVLLDFGIGVASSKILAEQFTEKPHSTTRKIRTIELFYLLISICLGIIVFTLSNFISNRWLNIDDPTINGQKIIMLMAVLLTVSWPKSLYENYLLGQKRIVQKNIAVISLSILRAIVMIYFVVNLRGGIKAYFYVMIITLFLETLVLRILAYRSLPTRIQFASFTELKPFLKYTSGIGVFSMLSLVIFQADRIFISKFMPTTALGIYSLSAMIPLSMFSLIYPITSAAFARLVKMNDNSDSHSVYHKSVTLLGVICVAFAGLVYTNFDFILKLWLREDSAKVSDLTAFALLAGTLFHSFTSINVNLLLVNGKSRLVALVYAMAALLYLLYLLVIDQYTLWMIAHGWLICNLTLFFGISLGLFRYYQQVFFVFVRTFFLLMMALIIYLISIEILDANNAIKGSVLLLTSSAVMILVLIFMFREFTILIFNRVFKRTIN